MVKNFWNNLSISHKTSILIFIITCLIIGYSFFVYIGFITITINGPVYDEIITGKDLIADVLPPPEYIIEPFQISLEMLEERDPQEINRSISSLHALEASYHIRHQYWASTLPGGEIRNLMVNSSYIYAMKFWDDVNLRFIPAMKQGDYAGAKKIAYESMKGHYEQHRVIIDKIVVLAAEKNLDDEKKAEQTETFIYVGMVCIAFLLLLTVIAVAVILFHLLKPLQATTFMIQEMSHGHLSLRLNLERKDEIGKMANAMDNLADYLQDTFQGFSRIAQGDLAISFQSKDEDDEIAPAFNHLIQSINDIMLEVRCLITKAEDGKLKTRGDPTHFYGIYQEIICGINNMLDAITVPLNEAIRVADEFSYARFSTRFDDDVLVKGDLIALKEGLNTIGEELSVVKYKLSLLSSITRHDILNQITVVKSGLDVIEENFTPEDPDFQVLNLIRSAVSNIKEQIGFTALYEQMGDQQPIWHQVSAIVVKTRDSLNTGTVTLLDLTDHLEIYADPMFGQVIYNLVDNALRHGKSLTRISFSFEICGERGVLIMTDDGTGIAEEDKNKIFIRGFGKNTGLGLFLIREILSFTHISIRETGIFGKGARFEMHIPAGKWRVRQVYPE